MFYLPLCCVFVLLLFSTNADHPIKSVEELDCPLRQLAFEYGTSLLADRGSVNLANALDLNSSALNVAVVYGDYLECPNFNTVKAGQT